MILFLIAVVVGFVKKQPRKYWLAIAAGIAIQFATGLLLAGNGTLQDPRGDGYVTAIVRQATNDGPAVAFLIIPVILLAWVVPFAIIRHNYQRAPISQVQFPPAGPGPAK
jgi:hypothetical protein